MLAKIETQGRIPRVSVTGMRVRLLLFAAARERAGKSEISLEVTGEQARAADVLAAAVRSEPGLAAIAAQLRVAVNHAFVDGAAMVREGDEVALLPPVSGGAGRLVRISVDPLVAAHAIAAVSDAAHGAIASFCGVVREHSDGRRVHRLDYEAYVPMAERVMSEVIAAIEERFPMVKLAIEHRVGSLVIGEIAVVVAAGAPHRREALAACAEAIDSVKATVPIWKREHTDDGATWVGCDGCARHEVAISTQL